MPPTSKAALPQDPSSPSGRSTVISMVRNKNNLEDLRLRRIIEEYDKEMVFRVKTHDFEKMDTYEFFRNLKLCNSDKMSQFKDLQQEIRDMPTPNDIELNDLSATFHSLDLHITGENKSFHTKNENGTPKNSAVKPRNSIKDKSRFPIIKRSQTEPLMSMCAKSNKDPKVVWQQDQQESSQDSTPPITGHSGSVIKSPKKFNRINTSSKMQVASKQETVECMNNAKEVDKGGETEDDKSCMEDVNGQVVKTICSDSLSKYPLVKAETGKIAVRHTEPLSPSILTNKSIKEKAKTLTISYPLLNDSESSSAESSISISEYASRPRTRTDASRVLKSGKTYGIDRNHENELISKSSPMLSPQNSLSKSSTKSTVGKRRQLLTRYDYKPPQKISLPTLLSMGIGTLKNPKEFQYRGILYAPWSHQGSKENTQASLLAKSNNSTDKQYKPNKDDNKELMKTVLLNKSKKIKNNISIEVRMQNFFTDVEQLIKKPEPKPLWYLQDI